MTRTKLPNRLARASKENNSLHCLGTSRRYIFMFLITFTRSRNKLIHQWGRAHINAKVSVEILNILKNPHCIVKHYLRYAVQYLPLKQSHHSIAQELRPLNLVNQPYFRGSSQPYVSLHYWYYSSVNLKVSKQMNGANLREGWSVSVGVQIPSNVPCALLKHTLFFTNLPIRLPGI